MAGLEEVRKAILALLDARGGGVFANCEWKPIKAAINEARSGQDEICAAMTELEEHRGRHTISVQTYPDGTGKVLGPNLEQLAAWGYGENPVAAIRKLIPPPKSTMKEDWEIVRQRLRYTVAVDSSCLPSAADAFEAFDRLRKRLEKP